MEVKSMTTQTPEKTKVNVLLGTTITLLNREFAVVFEKNGDEGNTFLLIPTKKNVKGITLQEMKDGIKKLFGGQNNVNMDDLSNLPDIAGTNENDVTFNITMAYLYIKTEKDQEQGEPSEGQDKQKPKKVEFAFQVTATGLDKLLPQGLDGIFTIHEVHLAIWSTQRKKICEAMQLITPNDFLNNWQ